MSDSTKYTPIGDWVDWMEGVCPIKGDILIEIKLRGTTTAVGKAGIWWWGVEGGIGDIIPYRLVEEAKPIEIGKVIASDSLSWPRIEFFASAKQLKEGTLLYVEGGATQSDYKAQRDALLELIDCIGDDGNYHLLGSGIRVQIFDAIASVKGGE